MDNDTTSSNGSHGDPPPPIPFSDLTIPTCQWILYADINNSRIRVWDLSILIPNSLFLLFLILRLRPSLAKLKASSSPIFTAFYVLIFTVSIFGTLRCIVSMTVNASTTAGKSTDEVLWLVLRFFLLATELSVVVFGLGFGHLDSRSSIRRVLFVTVSLALVYSAVQCYLELMNDHKNYKNRRPTSSTGNGTTYISYDLFAHGGMIFLFGSSTVFFLIYAVINILPFTSIRDRFLLPTKPLFYFYCGFLACLNLAQAVASLLLYNEHGNAQCVIDLTSYIYFSLFNPLVYGVFLWKFFQVAQQGIQFSYKSHDDDLEDDQVSLPYSAAAAAHKSQDRAPIFSYDSTHFDVTYSGSGSHTGGSAASPSVNSDYVATSINDDDMSNGGHSGYYSSGINSDLVC